MRLIRIMPIGRMGNQMLQLMFAHGLASRIGDTEICGYDLPCWGLSRPVPEEFPKSSLRLRGNLVDANHVARLAKRRGIKYLSLDGLGFRLEYFPCAKRMAKLFSSDTEVPGYDDDYLVIHIRAGDIAGGRHPDYGLLDPAFYKSLIDHSGRRPVFIGELDDSPYTRLLRDSFPAAKFHSGGTVIEDFQTIRNSRHIVLSVSTFAWLAAWLSDAESVYVPVRGFLDPRQRPDINLLPENDGRFKFHLFASSDWFRPNDPTGKGSALTHLASASEISRLLDAANRRVALKWLREKLRLEASAAIRTLS